MSRASNPFWGKTDWREYLGWLYRWKIASLLNLDLFPCWDIYFHRVIDWIKTHSKHGYVLVSTLPQFYFCPCLRSDPFIPMMQTAKNRNWDDLPISDVGRFVLLGTWSSSSKPLMQPVILEHGNALSIESVIVAMDEPWNFTIWCRFTQLLDDPFQRWALSYVPVPNAPTSVF